MFSRTVYAQHPVTKNLHISPRLSPTTFYRDANSVLLLLILIAHLLYSSINNLYAQDPVFEIVHDESGKVYLRMICTTREYPAESSMRVEGICHLSPVLANDTPLYSRLYAQKTLRSKLFKRAWRSVRWECPAETFMRSIIYEVSCVR